MASRWCQRWIDPIAAILTGFGLGCTGFPAFPVSLIKDSKRLFEKSENPRRQCSIVCYPMNTPKETSCLLSQSRSLLEFFGKSSHDGTERKQLQSYRDEKVKGEEWSRQTYAVGGVGGLTPTCLDD